MGRNPLYYKRKRNRERGNAMYDVIVLGATFAAAGIAQQHKEKCLVIERGTQAGYEFFGALNFAVAETEIYSHFKSCHTLFGTELVSVEKTDDGFGCVTHGVQGFYTYYAKKVIDTRSNAEMSLSKSYNLLIDSKEEPAFSNLHWEKTKGENRYIVYCPVPLSYGYAEARAAVQGIIEQFSETQRLIFSANEFDYHIKEGYPKTQDGILYLPSKAYENPALAVAAGLEAGEKVSK